jgi:hypothetical protein
MPMRTGLLMGLLVAAVAEAAQPGLEDILEAGARQTQGAIRWGMSGSEIQSAFPRETLGAAPGFPFQATVVDSGCSYHVTLNRGGNAEILSGIRVEYAAGEPEKCRAQLEHRLDELYGQPATSRHEAGWRLSTQSGALSGPLVQLSWQTTTTCIGLSWKEGTGFPGSPLAVTLGDRQRSCGYDDQVVPVQRRP